MDIGYVLTVRGVQAGDVCFLAARPAGDAVPWCGSPPGSRPPQRPPRVPRPRTWADRRRCRRRTAVRPSTRGLRQRGHRRHASPVWPSWAEAAVADVFVSGVPSPVTRRTRRRRRSASHRRHRCPTDRHTAGSPPSTWPDPSSPATIHRPGTGLDDTEPGGGDTRSRPSQRGTSDVPRNTTPA